MEKFVSSLQSYSGILLLMLLIVVVILLVCVFNLSLGLNRLSRKYAIFKKVKMHSLWKNCLRENLN